MSRKSKGRMSMHNEYKGGYYKGNNHTNHSMKTRGWDTGDAPKVCENCDYLPKTQKTQFMMEHTVWKALMGLCAKIEVEWQALLRGTVDADGVVKITGYYIPKQEVGPASVKNLDVIDDVFIAEHHIVAGVHSHAGMACFFSSTDVDHTNMSLIRHNIVVNNEGKYKAQSRVDLPCGMVKFIEGELMTYGEPAIVIPGIENIIKKTYGFENGAWNTTKNTPKTVSDKKLIEGIRWCPVCEQCPEEDSGATCVCWTKATRPMLPEFTLEHYDLTHGKSYELKYPESLKYLGGTEYSAYD